MFLHFNVVDLSDTLQLCHPNFYKPKRQVSEGNLQVRFFDGMAWKFSVATEGLEIHFDLAVLFKSN